MRVLIEIDSIFRTKFHRSGFLDEDGNALGGVIGTLFSLCDMVSVEDDDKPEIWLVHGDFKTDRRVIRANCYIPQDLNQNLLYQKELLLSAFSFFPFPVFSAELDSYHLVNGLLHNSKFDLLYTDDSRFTDFESMVVVSDSDSQIMTKSQEDLFVMRSIEEIPGVGESYLRSIWDWQQPFEYDSFSTKILEFQENNPKSKKIKKIMDFLPSLKVQIQMRDKFKDIEELSNSVNLVVENAEKFIYNYSQIGFFLTSAMKFPNSGILFKKLNIIKKYSTNY